MILTKTIIFFFLIGSLLTPTGIVYSRGLWNDSLSVSVRQQMNTGVVSENHAGSQHNFVQTSMYVSAAAVVTVGLIHYDQQIYNTVYSWKRHNSSINTISPEITNLGGGAFSFGLFGSYLGYGALFSSPQATRVGKIGLESFAVSGVVVQMMKYLFGRERPDVATRAGGKWNGPLSYFNRDPRDQGIGSFDAFPSGHTATIFAAATTISDAYDEPWVSYVSYSIASGVAISRVMERTHWMSDCFVGGLIGILSTRVVEKFNSLPPSVTIEPAKFPHAYGVKVVVGM